MQDPSTGQLTYPSNPEKKSKPIIIHSYSSTKTQGQINVTELLKKSDSLKKKRIKLVRPTFHRKNDGNSSSTTLAPPRLPSFYQFTVTSTTPKSVISSSDNTTTRVFFYYFLGG